MGDSKSKSALGFLTVIEDPDHGLFGGYLVLNPAGRPLEFHCTTPIKPTRAQQILYGPTLEPYLFGEQIGLTLVTKATAEPLVVCTDRPAVLAMREHVRVPVTLVLPPDGTACDEPAGAAGSGEAGRWLRLDTAHGGDRLVSFVFGRNRLAVPMAAEPDRELIVQRLAVCAEAFDLAEPFQRIREAIAEARRGGQSG
ncbi:MAG: hypothetical protein NUV77_25080, partial [Thermoguttaceae bacterium]|jgi:hypothetical protein|nr:hypothetical protein [Thermoguttaceae bacterium]